MAAEAERLLGGCEPPEDQGGPYLGFFAVADAGDGVPAAFTEAFVRDRLFGGAIPAAVGVEVEALSAGSLRGPGGPAGAFVEWFTSRLHGWAHVSIGTDTDVGRSSHPQLALAFTDRESVVGVCGYVVWA